MYILLISVIVFFLKNMHIKSLCTILFVHMSWCSFADFLCIFICIIFIKFRGNVTCKLMIVIFFFMNIVKERLLPIHVFKTMKVIFLAHSRYLFNFSNVDYYYFHCMLFKFFNLYFAYLCPILFNFKTGFFQIDDLVFKFKM